MCDILLELKFNYVLFGISQVQIDEPLILDRFGGAPPISGKNIELATNFLSWTSHFMFWTYWGGWIVVVGGARIRWL